MVAQIWADSTEEWREPGHLPIHTIKNEVKGKTVGDSYWCEKWNGWEMARLRTRSFKIYLFRFSTPTILHMQIYVKNYSFFLWAWLVYLEPDSNADIIFRSVFARETLFQFILLQLFWFPIPLYLIHKIYTYMKNIRKTKMEIRPIPR